MTRHLALLRGVNIGQRQVKSADLAAAFSALGYTDVKTLLASGNVLFDAPTPVAEATIEAALATTFGFDIGVVLRTQQQLRALIATDPFGGTVEDADTKLYVIFLRDPLSHTLPLPCAVAGDFEVVHVTPTEVCMVAFRQPTGRFGAGMDQVAKHFSRHTLWTSRNFNTVLKAAA